MGALARRGTSNTNARGSSEDRRRRRAWLVETYRADRSEFRHFWGVGMVVVPCCRCYRCGVLLTEETVTVDRIIPGCKGGTYKRSNIRPACETCNSSTGGRLASRGRRASSEP